MTQNSIFNYSFVSNENESYFSYSLNNSTLNPSRFVINFSGMIQQQMWLAGHCIWNIFWFQPRQNSNVYALCGAFGMSHENVSIPCQCLQGFEPFSVQDSKLNDWSGGCVRKSPLQCEDSMNTNGERDWFLKKSNVRLPVNSKVNLTGSATTCELVCMKNCSCAAYAYNSSSGCMIWEGPLLNLQQLSDGGEAGQDIYLRLSASEHRSTSLRGTERQDECNDIYTNSCYLVFCKNTSFLVMVELTLVLFIIIRQQMETMGHCKRAAPCNSASVMALHLFFKQGKGQTQR